MPGTFPAPSSFVRRGRDHTRRSGRSELWSRSELCRWGIMLSFRLLRCGAEARAATVQGSGGSGTADPVRHAIASCRLSRAATVIHTRPATLVLSVFGEYDSDEVYLEDPAGRWAVIVRPPRMDAGIATDQPAVVHRQPMRVTGVRNEVCLVGSQNRICGTSDVCKVDWL